MDCVYRNVSADPRLSADSSYNQDPGHVITLGARRLVRECTRCFSIWDSATRTILAQGCWEAGSECGSSSCTSQSRSGNGVEFCCCSGPLCNQEFKSGDFSSENPSQRPTNNHYSLVSLTSEEQTRLTYALVCILSLLVIAIILVIWRISKTCRPAAEADKSSLSGSQVLLLPPKSPPGRINPPSCRNAASIRNKYPSSSFSGRSTATTVYNNNTTPHHWKYNVLPPSLVVSNNNSNSSYNCYYDGRSSNSRNHQISSCHHKISNSYSNSSNSTHSSSNSTHSNSNSSTDQEQGLLSRDRWKYNVLPRVHMTSFLAQNLLLAQSKSSKSRRPKNAAPDDLEKN